MITPEMVVEAFETSHDECDEIEGGCIHAAAFSKAEADGEIKKYIEMMGLAALHSGNPPLAFVVFDAIHVGYRLRQIEEEGTAKSVSKLVH